MTRPARLEFPNALYHAISHGHTGENLFIEDDDRQAFLVLLEELLSRHDIICYAFCLMDGHYELLVETPKANLSQLMRGLNGRYTKYLNKKNKRIGHLFQGRYKAVVVQKELYLLELSRYIILNPVRAGLVNKPESYPWSSYSATIRQSICPDWLAAENLINTCHNKKNEAAQLYKAYVENGIDQAFSGKIQHQIYLGDQSFIYQVKKQVTKGTKQSPKRAIEKIISRVADRNTAMKVIYKTGHYTMFEIARYFNVHYSTVSRAIR